MSIDLNFGPNSDYDYLSPDGSTDFSGLLKPAVNPVQGSLTGMTEIDAIKALGLQDGLKNADGSVFNSGANPDMGFFTKYNDQIQTGLKGLDTLSGLVSSYVGIKQLGYAKDALKEGKRQFNLNFGAQRNMINSQLSDRQAARVDATGGQGHMSQDEYMAKYGVK